MFLLRGIRRWWRDDPASSLPYLVALFFFPIPYYFTHSSMDYRQPIEPMILSLVVIGIFGLREKSADAGVVDEPFLSDLIGHETEDEDVSVAAMGLAPSV